MLHVRAVVLATALVLAPLGARGADLVVWQGCSVLAGEGERTAG
jgi:hypothetical protein